MTSAICDAIKSRSIMSVMYHDERRLVEPHALGHTKLRELTLHAWQLSGPRPGWRHLKVDELSDVKTTAKHFAAERDDYHPEALGWTFVCRL
jgi:hypothetical protein